MKHFDLSRFWLTLKADNVLQWKTSLRLTLGMAFALTTIYIVNSLGGRLDNMGEYDIQYHYPKAKEFYLLKALMYLLANLKS